MHFSSNFYKIDVVFSASKAKDLEAAMRTIIEVMSWVDLWTYSAKSLILSDSSEVKKVKHLFVVGIWCQLLMPKMALTI